MKQLMIKLGQFIIDNKIPFRRVASGKGFITNDISLVVQHKDSIEKLIEPLGWKLLEMKPKYNEKTSSMSNHSYYLGLVDSKDCQSSDDFVIE